MKAALIVSVVAIVMLPAACSTPGLGDQTDETSTAIARSVTTTTTVAPTTTEAPPTTSSPTTTTTTTTTTATTTTLPPEPTYAFPVQPAEAASYSPFHHDYPAADIFAPCGSTVGAPTAGVILELTDEDVWDPSVNDGATRGGLSVTLVGDDGIRYYGSHLLSIDAGITPGTRVDTGQPLGEVGDTGNAAGTGCHLHFGISPPCGIGDWQVRRGTIPPAPYLDAWRDGDHVSPLSEITVWRDDNLAVCP